MEIRMRQTGEVLNEREFRAAHENVSFPATLDAATLAEYASDRVVAAPAPAVATYQSAQRNGVVQDGLGNWVHAWTVRDWSAEEIAAHEAAAATAARLAETDAETADSVYAIWRAKSRAQFKTDYTAMTTAEKLAFLGRVAFVVVRRG